MELFINTVQIFQKVSKIWATSGIAHNPKGVTRCNLHFLHLLVAPLGIFSITFFFSYEIFISLSHFNQALMRIPFNPWKGKISHALIQVMSIR